MRRFLIPVLVTCMAIGVYVTGYRFLVERHSGRARGAGEYFHYRDCGHSWEVYLFIPAAYCEAQLIQRYPKAFLSMPSWSAIPQRLIIRVPDNSITFSFPPWSKNTRKPNHAMQRTAKAFASRLALLRNEFSVFGATPCRGLSLSR